MKTKKTDLHTFEFICKIGNSSRRSNFWSGEPRIRTKVFPCKLIIRFIKTEDVFEMLVASICREVHFTVLSSTTMASRVPRCLFGKPNSRETVEMLHEALDAERSKFAKRWGVDPRSEDKENNYQRKHNDKYEQSPKKRSNPYSRQTSMHGEYGFFDNFLCSNNEVNGFLVVRDASSVTQHYLKISWSFISFL